MTKIKKGNKKTKKYFKRKAGKKSKKNVKKYYTGGAISEITNLYNYLLYKKGTEKETEVNFITDNNNNINNEKKALFVIDMQKDLLDKPYQRTKQGNLNPIFGNSNSIGNFSVIDGQNMVEEKSEFMNFIESVIVSDNYKHVFFSRVYHPIGHKSFSKEFKKAPALLCEGNCDESNYPDGNFPAHCVQGFEGSLFDDNIQNLLLNIQTPTESIVYAQQKVQIVFKGMHNDVDSFTAVDFDMKIDDIASNNQGHCKCTNNNNQCSGSYLRNNGSLKDDITFNETVNNIDEEFTKVDYTKLLEDVNVIEVCGFSGDYSVRDTIVALSNMFPKKKIILLGDFTRYISLPFNTITKIPIHINNLTRVPNEINNLLDIDEYMGNQTIDDIQKIFVEQVKEKINKDIRYYLIHYDEHGTKKIKNNNYDNYDNLFDINSSLYHFITPHSVILSDYKKENIFIKITKPEEPSVESTISSDNKNVTIKNNNNNLKGTNSSNYIPGYLKGTKSSDDKNVTIKNNNNNLKETESSNKKNVTKKIKPWTPPGPLKSNLGKGNVKGGKSRKIKRKIRK